ncbi:hypothetical protein WL356_08685 [Staphylococcus epidermidis]|uniref:hypothetical protein n=1 Tax=Staphylococcus epidermidis TaxID=1282 RepID=UPI00026C0BE4|nr:hypothetical protein [Staphylococcus epidermidis]EJD96873.1 hypothetical protein HMPREF9989_01482 [Staphylococcus epidermidis NIHLM057]EJD98684.1 hypothetical protein HMPREF9988_01833 [Staphylococcus epidermidis NIHLM053]
MDYYSIYIDRDGKREIKVQQEKLFLNEGKKLTLAELFEFFDYEKFKQRENNKSRISGNMIKGLMRTANQFYDDCVRVKDSRDKRKTLYQLGRLHNPDGSPIKRDDKRKQISEFNLTFRILLISILYNKSFSNSYKSSMNWLKEFGFINNKYVNDYFDINNSDKIYNNEHIIFTEYKDNGFISKNSYTISSKDKDQISSESLEDNSEIIKKTEMTNEKGVKLIKTYFNKINSKILYSLMASLSFLEKNDLIEYNAEYRGKLLIKNNREFPQYEENKILSDEEVKKYKEVKEKVKKQMIKEGTYKFYQNPAFIKRFNDSLFNDGILTSGGIRYFKDVSRVLNIKSKVNSSSLNEFLKDYREYKKLLQLNNEKLIESFNKLLISSVIENNHNQAKRLSKKIQEAKSNGFGDTTDLFIDELQELLNIKLMSKEINDMLPKLLNNRHSNNLRDKLYDVKVEDG